MIFFNKNKLNKLDDIALVEKYKHLGNTDIVGILFERYYYLVYGICLKYLKNEAESQDSVLQIFENLITKLQENEIQNFNSWLYSVSKNHCLMQIRSNKRRNRREEIFETEKKITDELFENHNTKYDENTIKNLKIAIDKLKIEQRQCVNLFYIEEKTYKEVSQITGFTTKNVKSYIQNGKRNLRLILEKNECKQ